MPVKVIYKIGKKPGGNWRTPLEFNIAFEGEDLQLRPLLVFEKDYNLPDEIYFGRETSFGRGADIHKKDGDCCKKITAIRYRIDRYIDEPVRWHIVNSLSYGEARFCISSCDGCKAYLPWRPGLPDYSDYEEVFRQVAQDLAEAWNQAVAEAMTSEEFESEQIIITPDNYLLAALKKEGLPTKFIPIRKLKIEERR